MREPPRPSPPDPVEELLREWPELETFGVDGMKVWGVVARERLVEIARECADTRG